MMVAKRKRKYRYIRDDDNYTRMCQCAIKSQNQLQRMRSI